MRLNEFSIRHYGPLPDTGRTQLSGFNLFFGTNETGKTLVIDALVKILFKQNRKIFRRINRVDGEPDGYAIVEDDKGKKMTLPEKGDLTKICGLSSSECRNLFIIRNSDLSIAQEGEFYINVIDRLTGLRTEETSSIRKKLEEIGKLTRPDSGASLSDKWGKIKTKVKKARALINEINELEREIEAENFDQIEEKLTKATGRINEIEQELNSLENARKREKYEKGDSELGKLRMSLESLKGINLEETKRLEFELNNYRESKEKISSLKSVSKFFTASIAVSAILLLASIFGIIIRPLSFLFYLTNLFILSTVILGVSKFYFVARKVQLEITFNKIRKSALQLGVDGESIGDINSNIQKIDENASLKTKAETILESYFSKKGEDLQANLSYWKSEIDALKEYKDKAKDITYDEQKVSGLKGEKERINQKKEQLQTKMTNFGTKLKEVERKSNEFLRLEGDYLHCDTSLDLKSIREKSRIFIAKIENNKNNVLEVMKIFEEIEKEEEEKVSQLFGKDSLVSKYFCQITDGIYQEVDINLDEKRIKTKLKNGEILDAEKLSGGAYDQLYLSIRLALGEKLLKGNKGFFIMDDPFIKADMERLRKQIDILKGISESGWQIMYFTAKDEVKDVLKKDITNNKVNYIEIPGIFS